MSASRPEGLPAPPNVPPPRSPPLQVLGGQETAKAVFGTLLQGVGFATRNHVSSAPRSPGGLVAVPVTYSTPDRRWTQMGSAPKEGDLVRDSRGEWARVNEVRRDDTAAVEAFATPVSFEKAENLREEVCAIFFAALRDIVALAGVSRDVRMAVLDLWRTSRLPQIWGLTVATATYDGICNTAEGINFKKLAGAVSSIATFGLYSSKEMVVRKPERLSEKEKLKASLTQMRILKPDELGPWLVALSQLLLHMLRWPFENFSNKLITADPSVIVSILIQVLETAQARGDYNPLERLTPYLMNSMMFNPKLGTAPWIDAIRFLRRYALFREAMPAAIPDTGIVFPPVHGYLFAGVGAVPASDIIKWVKQADKLGFASMVMPDKHAAAVAQRIGLHWYNDANMMELLGLLRKQQGFVVKILRKAAGLPTLPGGRAPLFDAALELGQLPTPSVMRPALGPWGHPTIYAQVCASPFL